MKLVKILNLGLILLWLPACTSMQPILYPNAHLQSVGKEVAVQDIEACKQLAASAGAEEGTGKSGDVASSTVIGAGIGAASGAAGGAVTGAAGTGSMVGAASGAVWGFLRALFSAGRSSQPNQAYANFVTRCLHEKGYYVTGWQ
ncbi:glycine zipper family protein [Nitrosomonas communis]|mgnify:CR=1 FL=1|uniref:glycine zipper family protein n=1 Tax=Nitrosomonas communis TaxID=44574 RepID=UPI0026EAC025|nr:glycine zipper family protein [Nitrosomonas communis]MCO6429034.1 hypothetical protein [Nitrosomonas communis]